jgi:hypothetical protein
MIKILLILFTILNNLLTQGVQTFSKNSDWQEINVTVANNSEHPIHVKIVGKSNSGKEKVFKIGPIAPGTQESILSNTGTPGSIVIEAMWEEEGNLEISRPLTINFKEDDIIRPMTAHFEIIAGYGTWSKLDWEK